MTTFPDSPRLLKGTIVGLNLFNPVSSLVVLQYNPDTVTRSLQVQGVGDDGNRSTSIPIFSRNTKNSSNSLAPLLSFGCSMTHFPSCFTLPYRLLSLLAILSK